MPRCLPICSAFRLTKRLNKSYQRVFFRVLPKKSVVLCRFLNSKNRNSKKPYPLVRLKTRTTDEKKREQDEETTRLLKRLHTHSNEQKQFKD